MRRLIRLNIFAYAHALCAHVLLIELKQSMEITEPGIGVCIPRRRSLHAPLPAFAKSCFMQHSPRTRRYASTATRHDRVRTTVVAVSLDVCVSEDPPLLHCAFGAVLTSSLRISRSFFLILAAFSFPMRSISLWPAERDSSSGSANL